MIIKLTKEEFVSDSKLLGTLRNWFIDTYDAKPEKVFEYALKRNDTLYQLIEDKTGILKAVSFFNWNDFSVSYNGEIIKTVYLSLIIADPIAKSRLNSKLLWSFIKAELCEYATQNNTRILVYGRTINPIALMVCHSVFANMQPNLDGSVDESIIPITHLLRKELKLPATDDENVFLLKGNASYNYLSKVYADSTNAATKRNVRLFEKFDLDERNGDRILVVSLIKPDDVH